MDLITTVPFLILVSVIMVGRKIKGKGNKGGKPTRGVGKGQGTKGGH